MWIVDFPPGATLEEAALYEAPFEYVVQKVKPSRIKNKREIYAKNWWLHMELRPGMRAGLSGLDRYIAKPRVSKHRLFVWISCGTLPDSATIAFARDYYYFFGILHSRIHELWARAFGTQLDDRPCYMPTSTFETFPFPEPKPERRADISAAARRPDTLRNGWLNPPADSVSPSQLRQRTLTNPHTWLRLTHKALDEAAFTAYNRPTDLTDGQILASLLELNLRRKAAG